LPGIYTLRNLQDTDRIKERVDKGAEQAVVVGAGFIGLDLVENFIECGIATTVVELQDQVLPPFDKEMTTPIVETLLARAWRSCWGSRLTDSRKRSAASLFG
jgi:NADPH-dependent 2,4-dienoyl-CoA reductase/sulfur reductase-like enzyme